MFFNYIQQGTKATWEHQVHYLVFARYIKLDVSIVFGIYKSICIDIRSIGSRVFV